MPELPKFPSLSEEGWVGSTVSLADYLFAHFIVSDYSQTQLYNGHVASLPWIIQECQDDDARMTSLMDTTLQTYFGRYFNNVVTEIKLNKDPENNNKANLSIYVKFKDNEGKDFVLGKLLSLLNSKVVTIIDINNG